MIDETKFKPYKKKPIIVEAYQTETEEYIETLEGTMKANEGDYIIKGIKGELYPCKPDVFKKTYDIENMKRYYSKTYEKYPVIIDKEDNIELTLDSVVNLLNEQDFWNKYDIKEYNRIKQNITYLAKQKSKISSQNYKLKVIIFIMGIIIILGILQMIGV